MINFENELIQMIQFGQFNVYNLTNKGCGYV